MQKKLVAGLAIGLLWLGGVGVSQAALVEINPTSYSFDKPTGTGSYVYRDWTGKQLIDGQYGTASWWQNLGQGPAYEWVGWVNQGQVNIDFAMGQSPTINEIHIGTVQDYIGDVVLPSVILSSSTNGTTWTPFAALNVPPSSANNGQYFTYTFTGLSVSAPNLRVSLSSSPWTFTDEIDFYHDTHATPEPATLLLLGSGIAGLLTARRQKKAQA